MRVLVVYCHPVSDSFCAALRDAAISALKVRGDETELVDLYAEGFDPVLSADERRNMDSAPTDPKLTPHVDSLRWAEAILFIYPTWWYGLPAMLKGWLDRVWWTDVAFKLPPDGGVILPLMQHVRKIAIVTTCGAPFWWSFMVGQPGRKTIMRGLRALCAKRCRRLYLAHYDMDSSTPESRARFMATVEQRLSRW